MAAQGLEKRLETTANGAAKDGAVYFQFADPQRALDLPRRRAADESDLDSLRR